MSTDNTMKLLTITDTCKELKIANGITSEVEKRLEKMGVFPVARVKGTQDGKEVLRPLYHTSSIVAFNKARQLPLVSEPVPQSDLEKRIRDLEEAFTKPQK